MLAWLVVVAVILAILALASGLSLSFNEAHVPPPFPGPTARSAALASRTNWDAVASFDLSRPVTAARSSPDSYMVL